MNISDKDREWIDSILKIPDFISASAGTATAATGTGSGRKKRQAPSLRIRTEYRLLNDLEREQYHRAVNTLKQLPVSYTLNY
jgi:hypothetical protein